MLLKVLFLLNIQKKMNVVCHQHFFSFSWSSWQRAMANSITRQLNTSTLYTSFISKALQVEEKTCQTESTAGGTMAEAHNITKSTIHFAGKCSPSAPALQKHKSQHKSIQVSGLSRLSVLCLQPTVTGDGMCWPLCRHLPPLQPLSNSHFRRSPNLTLTSSVSSSSHDSAWMGLSPAGKDEP